MGSQRRLPRLWVCGSLELTARSTKLVLDLGSPVERIPLPIFVSMFLMDHALYQTRSMILFSFPFLLPLFPLF